MGHIVNLVWQYTMIMYIKAEKTDMSLKCGNHLIYFPYLPGPRPHFTTFQVWKIWILIVMTLQDMCAAWTMFYHKKPTSHTRMTACASYPDSCVAHNTKYTRQSRINFLRTLRHYTQMVNITHPGIPHGEAQRIFNRHRFQHDWSRPLPNQQRSRNKWK